MKKKEILAELKRLIYVDKVDASSLDNMVKFKYDPINEYLLRVALKSKPEAAVSDLLAEVIKDIIEINVMKERNLEGGFVDIVLESKDFGNPILLELKPFLRLNKKNMMMRPDRLHYKSYMTQIQRCLKEKHVEYMILTNLNDAYIFNREAVLDFRAFAGMKLPELFERFLETGNLWDTISRIEDETEKRELDKEFFENLQHWYNTLEVIEIEEKNGYSKQELIVLLMNKVIFIKTLEDFGLIKYSFLKSNYQSTVGDWAPKGYSYVFDVFFKNVEFFFEQYYDTGLFKFNFWDYVKKSEANIHRFKNVFETVLGFSVWSVAFGKGMIHYNYRWIDEDVFGKAYETWIARRRKDTGIYYTPVDLTKYMAKKLVDNLFKEPFKELLKTVDKNVNNFEKAQKILDDIRKIRIIDPTSGSGSFLIKALREIYDYYYKIYEAMDWAMDFHEENILEMPQIIQDADSFLRRNNLKPKFHVKLISQIILYHIFAADKDYRALETAKTNIWKEAVKLHPALYNFRKISVADHVLPNLELNFIPGDSLADLGFDEEIEIISKEFKQDVVRLHEIRNEYLENTFHPEIIDEALDIKKNIRDRLKHEVTITDKPLLFCLEYFFCWFNEKGELLPEDDRGFSGAISNPPWEALKPVRKEFAEQKKYEFDILKFSKWFHEKLRNDEDFKDRWLQYKQFYKDYSKYLGTKYTNQGVGDKNYYKLFIERDLQLLKKIGYLNILVPSGFQTDLGSIDLRKLIIEDNTLKELMSFENRGYNKPEKEHKVKLFPDVDNRYKFSILIINKEENHKQKKSFDAKFYLHDPRSLYEDKPIKYNLAKIKEFSPENLSIMEFRDDKDYNICFKINDKHETIRQKGIQFRREFDMTNDVNLFHYKKDIKDFSDYLPLYEGKFIHQYNSNYGFPKYYINIKEAHEILLRKEKHRIKKALNLRKDKFEKIENIDDIKLDYETYRLAYRDIGRSTDERTFIASMIPANVFLNNKLICTVNFNYKKVENKIEQNIKSTHELNYLMALYNSLVLNYYLRNKISATLNMFYIYELPIPDAADKQKQEIVRRAFSLLYRKSNSADFEDLRRELSVEPDTDTDLIDLRAGLEVLTAKELYGLEKDEWEYICSTFTYGGNTETRHELDNIIERSKEIW